MKRWTEECFWEKVNRDGPAPANKPHLGPCWIWVASVDSNGYGHLTKHKKHKQAHRISYELLVGPIPEKMTLDHLCRVRRCVNPAHLEVVTMKENILRGEGPCAIKARGVLCQKGHAYTRITNQRICNVCRRATMRKKKLDKQFEETLKAIFATEGKENV